MRFALPIICLFLLQPVVVANEEFVLIGIVRTANRDGVPDVTVKIIGGDFATTRTSGEFSIPLDRDKIGRRINLEVKKSGWVVVNEKELEPIVPADPASDPVSITLKKDPAAPNTPGKSTNTDKRRTKTGSSGSNTLQKLMGDATFLRKMWVTDQSLKKYQEALAVAREGGFKKEEMECHTQIGKLQLLIGYYDQAKTSFKFVQSLAAELRSQNHLNLAVYNLAEVERENGNFPQARERYNDARKHFRTEKDKLGEANALRGLGDLESRQRNFVAAGQHYKDAGDLYLEANDKLGQAHVLRGLGDLARDQDDIDQAQRHYENARDLYQQVSNKQGRADALRGLGNLASKRGNDTMARESYNEALGLYQVINSTPGEATITRELGNLERKLGNNDEARRKYLKAADLFSSMKFEDEATQCRELEASLIKKE